MSSCGIPEPLSLFLDNVERIVRFLKIERSSLGSRVQYSTYPGSCTGNSSPVQVQIQEQEVRPLSISLMHLDASDSELAISAL